MIDIPEGRIWGERLDIEFNQSLVTQTTQNVLNYIIWPR